MKLSPSTLSGVCLPNEATNKINEILSVSMNRKTCFWWKLLKIRIRSWTRKKSVDRTLHKFSCFLIVRPCQWTFHRIFAHFSACWCVRRQNSAEKTPQNYLSFISDVSLFLFRRFLDGYLKLSSGDERWKKKLWKCFWDNFRTFCRRNISSNFNKFTAFSKGKL
jgi:hypothetical protein